MNPGPALDTVILCAQALTAGVILFSAFIDLLTNIREKHPTKKPPPPTKRVGSSPPNEKREKNSSVDENS